MSGLAAIPVGFGKILTAFRKFGGNNSSVTITDNKLTHANVLSTYKRTVARNGGRVSVDGSVQRKIPAIAVRVKVTVVDNLDRVMDNIFDEVHSAVVKAADLLYTLSFRYCPRDTGRLESSGFVQEIDEVGDWPIHYSVDYGPAVDPGTGVDYSLFAHFGDYNRGPGTQAKDVEAGPMFLTRAVEVLHNTIVDLVADAVRRGTR